MDKSERIRRLALIASIAGGVLIMLLPDSAHVDFVQKAALCLFILLVVGTFYYHLHLDYHAQMKRLRKKVEAHERQSTEQKIRLDLVQSAVSTLRDTCHARVAVNCAVRILALLGEYKAIQQSTDIFEAEGLAWAVLQRIVPDPVRRRAFITVAQEEMRREVGRLAQRELRPN